MKKLMFLAAVAAATVASANVCVSQKTKGECGETDVTTGAGTAHKVAITLKTTGVQSTTKNDKSTCSSSCTYYRVQKTVKINGLIWEQLADCTGCTLVGTKTSFWTSDAAIDAEFAINIGLIGKSVKSTQAEAYGTLEGADFGELAWAGFGSITDKTTKKECVEDECTAWLKSISGGIAGWLVGPEYDATCSDCDAIVYVGCCDDIQLENTAAYGTIKITYDAATAKKVALAADGEDLASFYKVPVAPVVNDLITE